jgi:hypothetical protein
MVDERKLQQSKIVHNRKTRNGKYPCYIAMLLVVRICDGT